MLYTVTKNQHPALNGGVLICNYGSVLAGLTIRFVSFVTMSEFY